MRFLRALLLVAGLAAAISAYPADLAQSAAFPALGGAAPSDTVQQAFVKLYSGELADAKKLFTSATEANKDEHGAWYGLGILAIAENDFQAGLEHLCKATTAARDNPWAEQYLTSVESLLIYCKDPTPFTQLTGIAADAKTRPVVRDLIHRMNSHWQHARGRFSAAAEAAKNLQYAAPFALIGPFDNRDGAGMATEYEPEALIDFEKASQGRNRRVNWFRFESRPWNGICNLSNIFEPRIHGIAYAATLAKVEKAGWAVLRSGCAGALKAWVNGAAVADQKDYHDFGHDKVVAPVYLHQGWNLILLKSGVVEETEWCFDMRLCAPEGGAYPGITYEATPAALAAYKKESAGRKPEGEIANADLGLRLRIEQELKAQPESIPLLSAYATLLERSRFGPKEYRAAPKQMQKAISLAPKSPHLRFKLASLTDDSNEARQAAEAAYATHPDVPAALDILADLAERSDLMVIAEDYARRLLKQHGPDRSGGSLLVMADVLGRQDSGSRGRRNFGGEQSTRAEATHMLEQFVERHPYNAEGWRRLVQAERSRTRRTQWLEKGLALNGGDMTLRNLWQDELAQRGKEAEAAEHAAAGLAAFPCNTGVVLNVCDRYQRAGNDEQATRVLDEALRWAPENPELLQELAMQKHRMKKNEEAVALLKKILQVKPNSPQVKDYLARLDQGKALDRQFFAPYDIALKDLKIPNAELYPESNLVHMLNQEVVRVNPNGSSSRMVHLVSKLLRPAGEQELARHQIYYEPERQVVDILRAAVITPDGRELSRADVSDRSTSAAMGVSTLIYDEHHLKVVSFKDLEPGCIVDLQYTIRDTGDNIYGDYFADTFHLSDDSPILQSQYVLDYPKNLPVQTRTFNTDVKEERLQSEDTQREVVKWEAKNTPGIVMERGMPPVVDQLAQVQVTTMKSWEEVGQWYWHLAKDQLALNEQMKKDLAEITKDAKTDTEKLRAVHDWVIKKIRYLGIEFGRNGYKPHKATETYKALYGDCKDTATLLSAMLPHVGIDCKLVLIRTVNAGNIPADTLPMPNLFNHAIAYVPNVDGKDYWIDGTTDFHRLGEVPWSDQGAQVLVVDDKGGKFVQIPRSKPVENLTELAISVKLAKDGSAMMTVR
ncbi:MAG TPA: DUF3857 domain-containing protein, partial [Planctomycetota bacterium]|nr:DUF3857 domain-containing protein [Planctomycetota bacterium]